MAFSSGNGGRPGMMSEINVTPLVDVMLVLLIIFMVAAPMMTQGLEVNLPKVDSQAIPTEDKQTILTIMVDGRVVLDKIELSSVDNLAYQVKQVMETKGSQMVLIRADRDASYGNVAAVMSRLQQAGITNIGLVTEPAERSDGTQNAGARAGG
ncbi:protein TolR [Deltaproteobacteria bacterium Smac51]|nr:protein TolR [Deltaproteobacteria bacterium Smac51]